MGKKADTVTIRINAAAFIKFLAQMRRLFEGGVYLRAAFIRGRRLLQTL